jgi:hypothetical protein
MLNARLAVGALGILEPALASTVVCGRSHG